MNVFFRTLLPVLGIFATAATAHAQQITSPYRFLDTKQEAGPVFAQISSDRGAVGLGAKSGPAFGGRFGILVSGPFQLELEGLYFPTEHAVLDTVVVDSAFKQIGVADQTLVIALASFRLNLTGRRTWNNLLPYISFGVGGVAQTSQDSEVLEEVPVDARFDFGTSFAGAFGAGIALFPSRRLSIRVDGRNLLWKVKTPAALLRSEIGRTLPADEWVQNLTASAGVSIHF